MADFDAKAAQERQNDYIRETQRIRDGLTRDVVDYYYESYPDSEEKYRDTVEGMRKYLRVAVEEMNNLIDRLY